MKKLSLALSLALTFSMAHAAENLGQLTLAESSARPLKTVLNEYKDGPSAPVLVKGTIKQVCEKKGCWVTLEDGGEQVRVFFKDYGLFASKKFKDKPALAEGVLLKKVRSVKDQKHILEDSGASAQAISAVKADKVFYEFEATALKTL